MNFDNLARNPYFRIGAAVATILVFIGLAISLFILGDKALFSGNKHFLLRKVTVNGQGYWGAQGRSKDIMKTLKLEFDKSNLFDIDIAGARKELARKFASIESVEIRRELPDRLCFDISERIPRAFLAWPRSPAVVDRNGILMLESQCAQMDSNMPVIKGFKRKEGDSNKKFTPGDEMPELKPALELITRIAIYHPKIKIIEVDVGTPDELRTLIQGFEPKSDPVLADIVAIPVKNNKPPKKTGPKDSQAKLPAEIDADSGKIDEPPKPIMVIFPVEGFKEKLRQLEMVIDDLRNAGSECPPQINMLFEGESVTTMPQKNTSADTQRKNTSPTTAQQPKKN